jgi:hypothetical protein
MRTRLYCPGLILVVGLLIGSLLPVAALAGQSRPPSLDQRVAALETAVAALQTQVAALQAENAALKSELAAIQKSSVMDLANYLTVDTGKHRVIFSKVNLQLVNGTGHTDTINGRGNLIIGYDLVRTDDTYFCADGQYPDKSTCEGSGQMWAVSHKSGSHYLVIGDKNNYAQYGGLVVGTHNTSNGPYASVSGGRGNTASGDAASVSGGNSNTANGASASVSGGESSTASGGAASVSGGRQRSATGPHDWVVGGLTQDQ